MAAARECWQVWAQPACERVPCGWAEGSGRGGPALPQSQPPHKAEVWVQTCG